MALAVRQEHPGGPRYQEARSYTFLVHSMKFARLAQMDDGRLVAIATGWLDKAQRNEADAEEEAPAQPAD